MNTKTEPFISKVYVVVIVVFTIILALLLFIKLLSNNFRLGDLEYTPSDPTDLEQTNIGIKNEINTVILGSSRYTLPTYWQSTATLEDTTGSKYKCVGVDNCKIVLINNDYENAVLKNAVLSAVPVMYSHDWMYSKTGEDILGWNFTHEKYQTLSSLDSATTTDLTLQLYGCKGSLCLQAGPFSTNPEVNADQYTEFLELLNGLN